MILPAAAPTILTGMRISMGIAWLVIVAAEMLVGGTGIGYFVWNEWNNLSLTNVIFAILVIGVVGMLLDCAVRPAAEGGDLCGVTPSPHRSFLPGRRACAKTLSAGAARRGRVRGASTSPSSKGEFVCIIGHSGCGKTTILNVLAGLDSASAGHVFMDGREVAGPSLERGVVFQGHALMPWLSVRENIAFAVRSALARLEPARRSRRTARSSSTWSGSTAPSTRSRRSSRAA